MTPEEALAAGYTGWCEHFPNYPCPKREGEYCLTCDGPLSEIGLLYIPENIDEYAPQEQEYSLEDSELWKAIVESLSKPLPPQCPLCYEERKSYACIFPPVPCPHGDSDTLTV